MNSQTRLVEVRTKILKANDVVARAMRKQFHDNGVYVVSLVSSPGSRQDDVSGKDAGFASRAFSRGRVGRRSGH